MIYLHLILSCIFMFGGWLLAWNEPEGTRKETFYCGLMMTGIISLMLGPLLWEMP